MLNKKSLIFTIIVFILISKNLFANNIAEKYPSLTCYKDLTPSEVDNLVIDNLSIKFSNHKKWVKNLFNINVYLEKKKNKNNHKRSFTNFRIKDEYKKKFDANIYVKFKNYKKCKFKAKVRVTGDLWWHLSWKKGSPISSLHVKLIDGNLQNITKFKLFLREARYDSSEIFVANFFKELGFISPKTFYINAKINNVDHDYIFQEDIKKELIESSFYREGPLLEGDERFTVNLFETLEKLQKIDTVKEKVNFPIINFAKIVNTNFLKRNNSNSVAGLEALTNMNKLFLYNHNYKLENKIFDPASNIFFLFTDNFFSTKNSEILDTFDALSLATDTKHGLSMDDRRFYFDSFTKFYLPIYYDGKSRILEKEQNTKIKINSNEIFSNEAILGSKNAIKKINNLNISNFLNRLKKSGLDMSKKELEVIINKILSRLKILEAKNNTVRNVVSSNNFFKRDHIKGKFIKFVFTNYNKKQFIVCGFNLEKCETIKIKESEYFQILNEISNQKFYILKQKIKSNDHMVFLYNDFEQNFNTLNFFNKNWKSYEGIEKTKLFHKNVDISVDIINKKIVADQTEVDGKILFLGGKLEKWNIIFNGISNNKKNDIINNYDISNNLTGCVNFYQIEFNLVNLSSKNGHCEDSINIIRSKGSIDSVLVSNSVSDALDVDFSNLKINSVIVSSAANDCIDFSAGNYTLGILKLKNCGDKALSVGEKSTVKLNDINVSYADTGIASKDSSVVSLNKAVLKNTKICLSAYNKKQEFNGGFIYIDSMKCSSYSTKIEVDNNSKILFKKKPFINNDFENLKK